MHLKLQGFVPPLGIHPERVEHSSSFPSDHAALAFALSAGIYVWRRSLGVVAIVWLVITTCFARVYAGYNYPTDVVAVQTFLSGWPASIPTILFHLFLRRL
jgi:undecaprenyl-diphosphatase